MLINGQLAKLGKNKARKDPRTLKLAKYLKPAGLPPVQAEVSWITKLAAAQSLPMYLNDKLGDCVGAAAGHMIQQWNFYAGHPNQPTDADILAAYEAVGGYDPGNPSTDNGMDMLTFLNYWKATGVGADKIAGYLAVDWTNHDEVQLALQLFGSLYIGVQLPVSAQGQSAWTVADGGVESDSGQPGSWGGHCIPVVASSPITKTVVTWGATLKMSNNFFHDYCDEAFAVLSQDWINASGLSPDGFDFAQLQADLQGIQEASSAKKILGRFKH